MCSRGEEGWALPERDIDHFVKACGGNPFCWRLDATSFVYKPRDPRLDPLLLRDRIQDYVSSKDLEALKASHTWWDSTPDELQAHFESGTVSFLSSGVLPDPQGAQETGKKKRILKVKVGAIERVPREVEHLEISNQVSKHKFPQDRWERHPGYWVRVHSRPRKSLFIPTGTKDGPNVNDLDRVRVTDVRFCDDDKTETVRGQWISSGGRSRLFKKSWTGCSIFQIKVPGKPPAKVEVVGDPDKEREIPLRTSADGPVFDNHAFVETPFCSGLSDDVSSSINSQQVDEAEGESWLTMDKYDLGFWIDMTPFEEDSGSEVVIEDQDPGPMGCSCASCQVESASRRCEHEGEEVCSQCVVNCAE